MGFNSGFKRLTPWHQYRRHEGYVGYTSQAALFGFKTEMVLQ